jgi:phage terminase small subunit
MTEDVKRQVVTLNRLDPALAEALASPADGVTWGPAMRALPSDRHRAFVLALYQVKPGHGAHVKAAKLAGFGSSTSSAKSWSVIASRLAHDEKIQEAMREEDEKRIRASAPRAVRALGHLIETPDHRDHVKAIGMVLDRVHPVEMTHHLKVDHTHEIVASKEVLDRIRELTLMVGLDPQALPPMIDGTCEDITDAKQQT